MKDDTVRRTDLDKHPRIIKIFEEFGFKVINDASEMKDFSFDRSASSWEGIRPVILVNGENKILVDLISFWTETGRWETILMMIDSYPHFNFPLDINMKFIEVKELVQSKDFEMLLDLPEDSFKLYINNIK